MNTVVPIIIPYNTEPDTCPECGKPEDQILICKHCGYEYPEEHTSVIKVIAGIIFGLITMWVVLTILYWLATSFTNNYNPETLLEIFTNQINRIKLLRIL